MNTKIVGYKINITEAGRENLTGLIQDINKLAKAGTDATPEYDALAKEVRKLGEQQAAIDTFTRLKKELAEVTDRQQELQERTKAAALAVKEKQSAVQAATAAEHASAKVLQEGKAGHEALTGAISGAKAELKSLKDQAKDSAAASADLSSKIAETEKQLKALDESGEQSAEHVKLLNDELVDLKNQSTASAAASEILAANIADTEKQLQVLQQEARSAADGVKLLSAAHKEDEAATKTANAESKQAQKEFGLVRDQATTAKDAVRQKAEALEEMRDKLREAGLSSKSLAGDQVELKTKIADMAAEVEKAQQVLSDREALGIKAHAEIQQEIDETRAAYERLKASGTLTSAELAQAALKTEDRVRELKSQTSGWTESIGKAKTALAGLVASGAGIGYVVNEAIKFESAMADVAKVVDGTDGEIAGLNQRIRQMTAEIPLSADALAEIAAAGGQLGIPIEKLDQFIQLAATMATAFNISAEEAGQAVAKLSNIFALPLEGVEKLGDAINTLGNTTAAKESDIIDVLTRIGGTAKQFGLTAEQAAALGTAMLSLGVSSEVAGTGINAILTKLQTANIQGADFQKALASMGISARQLAADIRADPQQALSEFLRTLETLDNASRSEILSRLFGAEYQDDVARLLAGLDGYEDALRKVADAGATAGAMQKEFQTRVETTEAQLQLLQNGVKAVAVNLGTILLPAIKPVVEGLGDITHGIAAFIEQHPAIAAVAGGVVTLVASVNALRLGWLAMSLAGTSAIASVTTAFTGMTAAAAAATGAAAAALSALGGVAAAAALASIGHLVYRVAELQSALERLEERQKQNAKTQQDLASRTAESLAKVSAETGVNVATMQEFEAALASGAIVANAAGTEWLSAAQKAREMALAATDSGDAAEQAAEQNQKAWKTVATELEALGVNGAAALGSISPAANEALMGIGALEASLKAAGATSEQTARVLEMAMQAAIPKADSLEAIAALEQRLKDFAISGDLTAESSARLQAALKTQREELQKQIPGAEEASSAYKKMADEIGNALQATADAARDRFLQLRDSGTATKEQIQQAFSDMTVAVGAYETHTAKAQQTVQKGSEQTAAALEREAVARVKSMNGQQELLVSETKLLNTKAQMARASGDVVTALDLEYQAALKQIEIDRMGLEIKRAELDINSQRIKVQMQDLDNKGQLTAAKKAELEQEQSLINMQRQGLGVQEEILNLQEDVIKSSGRAGDSLKDTGDKGKQAGKDIKEGAEDAAGAVSDLSDRVRTLNAIPLKELTSWSESGGKKLEGTWLSLTALASDYGDEAAAAAYKQIGAFGEWVQTVSRGVDSWSGFFDKQQGHLALLQRTSDEYVRQMELLDEQQRKLESTNSGAAAGVAKLQMRLLELEGSEVQIASAKRDRERAEIASQQALLHIEVQRAELRRDSNEVARIRAEISAYSEQLALLDQIYAAEQRKAAAAAKTAAEQEKAAAAAAKAEAAANAAAKASEAAAKANAASSSKTSTASTTAASTSKTASASASNSSTATPAKSSDANQKLSKAEVEAMLAAVGMGVRHGGWEKESLNTARDEALNTLARGEATEASIQKIIADGLAAHVKKQVADGQHTVGSTTTNQTITINLDNKSYKVATNEAGAADLTNLLKALESARRVAA